jgi:hypothetical protein
MKKRLLAIVAAAIVASSTGYLAGRAARRCSPGSA